MENKFTLIKTKELILSNLPAYFFSKLGELLFFFLLSCNYAFSDFLKLFFLHGCTYQFLLSMMQILLHNLHSIKDYKSVTILYGTNEILQY